MQTYSNAEIDEAIERIAGDVARRHEQPDFPTSSMEALIDQLRVMEAARRDGDRTSAALVAATVAPVFETYRPTNATSRSKAILVEVVVELLAQGEQPKLENS